MYSKRNIGWGTILRYAWKNLIFFPLYATGVFCIYHFLGWTFIDVPFQPLTVIGIAVAFYIGFKNSKSTTVFGKVEKYGAVMMRRHIALTRTICQNLLHQETIYY